MTTKTTKNNKATVIVTTPPQGGPRFTSIGVSYTRKVQPAQYESLEVGIMLWADVEGCEPGAVEEAIHEIRSHAKRHVLDELSQVRPDFQETSHTAPAKFTYEASVPQETRAVPPAESDAIAENLSGPTTPAPSAKSTPAPSAKSKSAVDDLRPFVVTVFGKQYRTAGVTGPTLEQVYKMCADFDKKFGQERHKEIMRDSLHLESRFDLNEEMGKRLIDLLSKALGA